MWKVAVVGAGTMGTVHAQAYVNMGNVDLVGIVDIRQSVAEGLAARSGTQAYTSLAELLNETDVDIVDICVPTYLHKEYVLQVARKKKHVICEKPIARSLEDAQAMINACEEAGVSLFIGHVVRFFPEYCLARDRLQSGTIGCVGTVRTSRGGEFPTAWEDWYADIDKSGSVIVDAMIHDFDFLRWCFGDVKRVYAKSTVGRDFPRVDHAFVSLRFENGIIGHAEGTWAYPDGFRTQLEIAGDQGLLLHDSDAAAPIQNYRRSSGVANAGVAVPESPLEKNPYQLELEHFLDCLMHNTELRITPLDAYKALEISLAALESIRTGQPVELGGVE